MPAGRHNTGPLWADGAIVLRVRDKKHRSWRMVKVRHPHLVIGSHPRADLVIARPDVDEHHAFLFLDARGLFGVDLRTERGTRFAGTDAEASWLGSGDLIEVADHQIEIIQLRVDGRVLSGPLPDDDPLGPFDSAPDAPIFRTDLTLRLLDGSNANWSIGSSLVFLGGGPACAVQLRGAGVGPTHAAIFRAGPRVFLVPFPGAAVGVNDRAVPGAVELLDGDVARVGEDALLVQIHERPAGVDDALGPGSGRGDRLTDRVELAVGPDAAARLDIAFGDYRPLPDPAAGPIDYPALIGRLQAETAALVAVLLRRIEALDDEMADLRERLDAGDRRRDEAAGPPVEKLRWDLIPAAGDAAAGPAQSGAWLVDRLRELEAERHSTWSSLLSRIGPSRSAD